MVAVLCPFVPDVSFRASLALLCFAPGLTPELKFADNVEVDPHRLATRQKQLDFGKNTLGYERYLERVPR